MSTTKYSKRTVDEAVQLLDVYASQRAWRMPPQIHVTLDMVQAGLGAGSRDLAMTAWESVGNQGNLLAAAAEAAQRLREGWRP